MISLTLFAVYFFSYPSLFSAQPSFNPITFQARPRDSRHILSSRDNLKTGFNLSNDNNLQVLVLTNPECVTTLFIPFVQYYTEVSIGGQSNSTLHFVFLRLMVLIHTKYSRYHSLDRHRFQRSISSLELSSHHHEPY